MVKAALERKGGCVDEFTKERCKEAYKEEKRKVKMCIHQSKKEVNEHFGRKMNLNVGANRKLIWEEMTTLNGGKVDICSRIKDRN